MKKKVTTKEPISGSSIKKKDLHSWRRSFVDDWRMRWSNILINKHIQRITKRENLTCLVVWWQKRRSLTDGLLFFSFFSFPLCSFVLLRWSLRDNEKSTSVTFFSLYIWGYYFERTNSLPLPLSLSFSLSFFLVSMQMYVKSTKYVYVTYGWTSNTK